MVLLEFSMYPIAKGESVSPYVARCLEIVEQSGLDYRCHATSTTIEGNIDQVMEVVRRCFDALAMDCDRIECNVRMDYRKGPPGRLEANVASVEQKLGHALKK